MSQNLNKNQAIYEEANIFEFIKKLLNSKILIILSTLIFTTIGLLYSLQKEPVYDSIATIEVGGYTTIGGGIFLAEPYSYLAQELIIDFNHKQKHNISISSLQNRLIKVYQSSISADKNTEVLNKVVTHLQNRHSAIVNNEISKRIDEVNGFIANAEVEKSKISQKIQFYKQELDNLSNLDYESYAYLEPRFSDYLERLYALNNQLNTLKANLYFHDIENKRSIYDAEISYLKQVIPNNTKLIGKIYTTLNKTNFLFFVLLGFAFGLFTGIGMAILRIFIENYKNNTQ